MFKHAVLVEEVNSLKLVPIDVAQHFGEEKNELTLIRFSSKIWFYSTGKPKLTADALKFSVNSPINSKESFCYGDAVFVKKGLFGYKPFNQDDLNLIKRNVIRSAVNPII